METTKSKNDVEDMLPNKGNLGFFVDIFGIFHSAATSVPMFRSHSSSLYGHTVSGYQSYTSYRHTSGGNVPFPTLGSIFSSAPEHSQNQNQSSQSYSSDNVSGGGVAHAIPVLLTWPAILTLQIIPQYL